MRLTKTSSISLFLALGLITAMLGQTPVLAQNKPVPETVFGNRYIQTLKPATSGPGLVVGEPVPVNCDTTTADFGAACSFWLQIVVGGQGAFGQTPLWQEICDLRRLVFHKPNRRYASTEVPEIAKDLGATHVATAQISVRGGGYVLDYRLFTGAGKLVGEPLTTKGTRDQILAALPGLARKINALLGVSDTSGIPDHISATAEDMAIIGQNLRDYDAPTTAAQIAQWQQIAPRSPLAGMFLVENQIQDSALVTQIIDQGHGNSLILSDLRVELRGDQPSLEQAVETALVEHPRNFALRSAASERDYIVKDWASDRRETEMLVRVAPRNPWAWMALGSVISDQADSVRHGGYFSQMSMDDMNYVSSLYPSWEAAEARATQLSPTNAVAYRDLATAATFNGDMATADQALWKSLRLDPTDTKTYSWGLQMYQPKWGGDTAKLRKIALIVAGKPQLFKKLYMSVLYALSSLPPDSFANSIEKRAFDIFAGEVPADDPSGKIATALAKVRSHPTGDDWAGLAKIVFNTASDLRRGRATSQLTSSESDWLTSCYVAADYAQTQAIAMNTSSGEAWGRLAEYRTFVFGTGPAMDALQHALGIVPHDLNAYAWGMQMAQPKWGGDESTVLAIVNQAAADPPLFEKLSPFIIDALASVPNPDSPIKDLQQQAQTAFDKLVQSNPQDPDVQRELAWYYDERGQADKTRAAYQACAQLSPKSVDAQYQYGLCLQRQGDSDGALAQYRAALALDPDDPNSLFNAGTVLIGKSQNAEAQGDFERLTKLQPLRASAYYWLGIAENNQGKVAVARSNWQKAVKLDPNNLDNGGDAQHMLDTTAPAPTAPAKPA
jgi:tetratricopeptide (TPR) repeat protein